MSHSSQELSLPDKEEHELHYNPRQAFPHFRRYQAARATINSSARARPGVRLDVPYGTHPLHKLDIYPAQEISRGSSPPVAIFLHGGYWRGQDKENFAFIGDALAANGLTAVIANYELCPQATLDGVVNSALEAVTWTVQNIGDFGANPSRITLCGQSAGAHLCAEVLSHDWKNHGVDPRCFRNAVLISGIYDPAPAMATTVNAELHLTLELAARHNVQELPPRVACDVSVFAGGKELWRWIDQSFRYAQHLRQHGLEPEVHVLRGYDHFNIINQFLVPKSALLLATLPRPAP